MAIGLPRWLATAGIMVAVLFVGPAAMVAPAQAPVQEASAVTEQITTPAPALASVAVPEAVQAAPKPGPAADIQTSGPLPWITAAATLPSAPGDIDAPYSGLLAAPKTDGLAVHAAPDGRAFGLLPARVIDSDGSGRTWMPVVGPATGPWLQVLLPARRNLPSSVAPVNGATGWVLASEVLTKASSVTVEVDLTAGTITVSDGGNTLSVFPVSISGGDSTARGRSFVMGRYSTSLSQRCSAQPMLILSAQSESLDGYFGQDTAVQAIHAFSIACRDLSGYTQATPGCIIVNEADVPRILALVPDGAPVTVKG